MRPTAVLVLTVFVTFTAAFADPPPKPKPLAATEVHEGRTLAQWIARLSDKDELNRSDAAQAVGKYGPNARDAVPALVKLLDDPKGFAFTNALDAVAAIGPEAGKAVEALNKLTRNKDPLVRSQVADALGKLGPAAKDAVPSLVLLVEDREADVRSAAVFALGDVARHNPAAAKRAVPPLVRQLVKDGTDENANRGLEHLGKFDIPTVFSEYRAGRLGVQGLRDLPFWIERIGPDDGHAVADLVKELASPDPGNRRIALGALARIGTAARAASPAVRRLLDDKDEAVRDRAKKALAALGAGGKDGPGAPATQKETRKRPEPDAATIRLLEEILGKPADAYKVRGYAGYAFGDSREKVEEKSPVIGRQRTGPFLVLKDRSEVLFGPEGSLVGIATTYSQDDNERAVEKFKDLFGVADKRNVEKFTIVNEFAGQGVREEVVRVTYHFPEAVVCVRFVFTTHFGGGLSPKKTERTFVAAFDRRWVLQELAEDAGRKRKSLDWFRKVVSAGHSGGFDREKLPPHPDANLEEGRRPFPLTVEGTFWTAKDAKLPEKKGRPREKEPHPEWFAAIGTQPIKTPTNPKGTVLCTLRFSKLPGGGEGQLPQSTLWYLAGRANSVLVQEAFPPRGETVTVTTNRTSTSYSWLTRDLLKVNVTSDNQVVVARPPGE